MLKSIHRCNERQSTQRYKTEKQERYSGVSEPERQVELCKQASQKNGRFLDKKKVQFGLKTLAFI